MYPSSNSTPTVPPFAESGETTNSAIRYAVTVGYRVSAPAIIALRDISYVMESVRSGFFESTDIRALIHTIRSLPNEALAKAMKANLPYFLGSVCARVRSNATVKYAHFAIFDLDHVADIEQTKQEALNKLPFLRWAFRSVRDGVKLVAGFDRPVTSEADYRVLWQYLAMQVEHALGLKVDNTPDWSRACFFSFDPGLLYNSSFKAVNVPVALQEAEWILRIRAKSKENREKMDQGDVTPFHSSTLQTEPDDFSKARSIVSQLAQLRIPYLDWIKCGMALYARFGEGGRELWNLFLGNPHYEETQKDLDHHWRSFRKVHTVTLASLFYVGEKNGCV